MGQQLRILVSLALISLKTLNQSLHCEQHSQIYKDLLFDWLNPYQMDLQFAKFISVQLNISIFHL